MLKTKIIVENISYEWLQVHHLATGTVKVTI